MKFLICNNIDGPLGGIMPSEIGQTEEENAVMFPITYGVKVMKKIIKYNKTSLNI